MLKCEIRRSMMNKDLQKQVEIFLQTVPGKSQSIEEKGHFSKSVSFAISPNTLQNVQDVSWARNRSKICRKFLKIFLQSQKSRVPDFKIVGKLYKTDVGLHDPVLGELVIKHCDTEIQSIDLQLIRIETRGSVEGFVRDGELIQIKNIQVGLSRKFSFHILVSSHRSAKHSNWCGRCDERNQHSDLHDFAASVHVSDFDYRQLPHRIRTQPFNFVWRQPRGQGMFSRTTFEIVKCCLLVCSRQSKL